MMRRRSTRLVSARLVGALVAGCLASGAALAQITPDPDLCSENLFDRCLDGVAPAVTGLDSSRLSAGNFAGAARKSQDDESKNAGLQGSGLSAGDTFAGYNVWGSLLHSDFDSDTGIAPYSANLDTLLFGIDRVLGERFVLGVAAGLEQVDVNTRFNGGSQDSDGLTIAPYGVFVINDVLSVDASVGYTHLEHKTERVGTVAGGFILGDFSSERVFGTANLNGVWLRGPWVFGARVGLLHTAEIQDAYNETGAAGLRLLGKRKIDLTQGYVGADIAYSSGAWEPYAVGSYHKDLSRNDGSSGGGLPGSVGSVTPSDKDEFRAGLGLRYFGDGVSGALEWQNTIDRDKFDEYSISVNVRIEL